MPREQNVYRMYVFLGAILFAVLGTYTTPDIFKNLPLFRGHFSHENELVRHTAETEVWLIRKLFFTISASLVFLGVFLRMVLENRYIQLLRKSTPPGPIQADAKSGKISLVVMTSFLSLGVVYLGIEKWFDPTIIELVGMEDGIVEWLTAITFLICSLQAGVLAYKVAPYSRKLFPLFLAIGFFMCFGEEISWGQRIFGWETPESIKSINVQDETNLHNMYGYFTDHLFLFGSLFYGGIIPFLVHRFRFLQNLTYRIGMPVATCYLAIGFILVFLAQDGRIALFITGNFLRPGELRECVFAIGYCMLMREALKVLAANRSLERQGCY